MKELRIALAMRGGVSLAVWIGGAVAEIDLLRVAGATLGSAAPPPGLDEPAVRRWEIYRTLLTRLEYDAVSVDVLAGASAGGLNAVLYGFTQTARTGFDWVLGVWQQQGDLWGLMRPAWTPDLPFGVPSLLRGDDPGGFAERLVGALDTAPPPDPGRPLAPRLTVDLAATLADGPGLTTQSGRRVARPDQVHFRFLHTRAEPGSPLDDFPQPAQGGGRLAHRLAYAARTTSSFPGAFEQATINSSGSPVPPGPPIAPESMRSVFSEVTEGTGEPRVGRAFKVMDGGIFDNVPISRALAAVADAPADSPVRRVLLYLDPSPPPQTDPEPVRAANRPPGREHWTATLVRTLLLRQYDERSDDEVGLVREHNAAASLGKRGTEAWLAAGPTSGGADPWASYAAWRGPWDAHRLLEHLVSPGESFLRTLVRPPATDRVVDQDHAALMRGPLADALAERHRAGAVVSDPVSLVLACERLIEVARLVEDPPPEAARALFRIRAVGRLLHEWGDLRATVTLLDRLDARFPSVARLTMLLEEAAGEAEPVDLGAVLGALDADEPAFWTALGALAGRPPVSVDTDVLTPLWSRVAGVAGVLHPAFDAASGTSIAADSARWCLALGAPAFRTNVEFSRLTADEAPDFPLPQVRLEGRRQSVASLLRTPRLLDPAVVRHRLGRREVRADSKLAGDQLGNFAGFLAAGWRAHDWCWGRADAAGHLATFLGADAEERSQLQWAVLEQAGVDRAKHRFSDLAPSYRFAVAARGGQLLQRALWPLTPSQLSGRALRPLDLALALPLMLLRPLLVAVPLAVRPMLLAALWLAVLAGQSLASATPDRGGLRVAAVVVGVGWLAAVPRLMMLGRRWGDLGAGAEEGTPPMDPWTTVAGWATVRRRQTRLALYLVVAGVIGCALVAVLAPPGPRWTLAAATTVTLLLAGAPHLVRRGLLARVPGTPAGARDIAGLVLLGCALVAWLVSHWLALPPYVVLGSLAGLTVAALQHAWTPRWWALVSSLAAGLALAAAVAWDLVSGADDLAWWARAASPVVVGLVMFGATLLLAVPVRLLRRRDRPAPGYGWALGLVSTLLASVGTWVVMVAWGVDAWVVAPLLTGLGAAAAATLLAPVRRVPAGAPVTPPSGSA